MLVNNKIHSLKHIPADRFNDGKDLQSQMETRFWGTKLIDQYFRNMQIVERNIFVIPYSSNK